MFRGLLLLATLAGLSASFAPAQESKMTIPVNQTHANDGKEMYVSYCASCHGTDGRGKGPASGSLKVAPVDLTQLSAKNKGVFPETHVVTVLRFGIQNSAHGSQAMPVWGPALQALDHPGGGTQDQQALRIANIVSYVETLQAK